MSKFILGATMGAIGGGYLCVVLFAKGLEKPENLQKFLDVLAKYEDKFDIDLVTMAKEAVEKAIRVNN